MVHNARCATSPFLLLPKAPISHTSSIWRVAARVSYLRWLTPLNAPSCGLLLTFGKVLLRQWPGKGLLRKVPYHLSARGHRLVFCFRVIGFGFGHNGATKKVTPPLHGLDRNCVLWWPKFSGRGKHSATPHPHCEELLSILFLKGMRFFFNRDNETNLNGKYFSSNDWEESHREKVSPRLRRMFLRIKTLEKRLATNYVPSFPIYHRCQ